MNRVHPTALIGSDVELGVDVVVGPYAVVDGPCRIGDGVWIGPHAAIGTPAQMRGGPHQAFGEPADGPSIVIGDRTVLREFCTVHRGTAEPTVVGEDCFVMAYAHVPHDARIGSRCTLSNSVQVGGHTWIGDGSNLGLGAVVHQWSVIGPGAMIGMQAVVTRPVAPYSTVVGAPARVRGANRRALEADGFGPEAVDAWAAHLRDPDLPVPAALQAVVDEHDRDVHERSR